MSATVTVFTVVVPSKVPAVTVTGDEMAVVPVCSNLPVPVIAMLVELLIEPAPSTRNVPADTPVAPVYACVPVMMSVPPPAFVKFVVGVALVPLEMTPLMVRAVPAVAVFVVRVLVPPAALPSEIGPPRLRFLVPP